MLESVSLARFPFGFFLGPYDTSPVLEDAIQTRIGNYLLQTASTVEVDVVSTTSVSVAVFGDWVALDQSVEEKLSARLANLAQESLERMETLLLEIAGRWVVALFRGSEVLLYNDAVGARTCFYSLQHRSAASHASLLSQVWSITDRNELFFRGVRTGDTLVDQTHFHGILQLICNHRVNLSDGLIERYYPKQRNRFSALSDDEVVAEIVRVCRLQLDHWFRQIPTVFFPLTGGNDSRVLLALLGEYVKECESFTYGQQPSEVASGHYESPYAADWRRVQRLLPFSGLKSHAWLDLDNLPPLEDELASWLAQINPHSHAPRFIPSYLELTKGAPAYLYRGNHLEIARAYWISDYSTERPMKRLERVFRSRTRVFVENDGDCLELDKQFARLVSVFRYGFDSLFDFDPVDLLYWEFRGGTFVSYVNLETDVAFQTINPFACHRVLELALSRSFESRKANVLSRAIIAATRPELDVWMPNSDRPTISGLLERGFNCPKVAPDRTYVCRPNGIVSELPSSSATMGFVPSHLDDPIGTTIAMEWTIDPSRSAVRFTFGETHLARDYVPFSLEVRVDSKTVGVLRLGQFPDSFCIQVSGLQDASTIGLYYVRGSGSLPRATAVACHLRVASVAFSQTKLPRGSRIVSSTNPNFKGVD